MASLRGKSLFSILCLISSALGWLYVDFYDQTEYNGQWRFCNDTNFDDDDICPIVRDTRSIKISIGTCVEMNIAQKSIWLTENSNDLGQNYKGGYVKKCETFNQTFQCPDGEFVKEIEWDTQFSLTRGIKLSCYKPESLSQSNATVLVSHPGQKFEKSEKRKCAAMYGVTIKIDEYLNASIGLDLKKNCTSGYSYGLRSSCIEYTALSGFDITIETRTNYIKKASIICTEIPDIATSCEADDERRTLVKYNGSDTATTMKIAVEKKFGVGRAMVMAESDKNEFEFYKNSGFSIQESLANLTANFQTNLGISNKTGFDWSAPQNSTWQNLQEIVLEVETKPGCATEITEIVGKCSFMEARPTQYVRLDTCNGTTTETTVTIPLKFLRTATAIPDLVKHKIFKIEGVKVSAKKAIEVSVKSKFFESSFISRMIGSLMKQFNL